MSEGNIQSLDTVVAVLQERIEAGFRIVNERFDTLRIHQSEFEAAYRENQKALETAMSALRINQSALVDRERERNDKIAKTLERTEKHTSHIFDLEQWKAEKEREEYGDARARSVLMTQWKVFLAVASASGGVGAAIVVGWNLLM